MKKVTVYSTVGKKATVLENIEASTWSELKTLLRTKNVQYNQMKAVIGETKHTLESDRAVLPDGDFSLFLMPVKTKSGAGERKALMDQYKASEAAKKHFHDKGLQITRMKTEDIQRELSKVGLKTVEPRKATVEPQTARVKREDSDVKKSSLNEREAAIVKGLSELDSYVEAAYEEGEIDDNVADEIRSRISALIDLVKGINPESKLAEELEKTARDIAGDFADVRSF